MEREREREDSWTGLQVASESLIRAACRAGTRAAQPPRNILRYAPPLPPDRDGGAAASRGESDARCDAGPSAAPAATEEALAAAAAGAAAGAAWGASVDGGVQAVPPPGRPVADPDDAGGQKGPGVESPRRAAAALALSPLELSPAPLALSPLARPPAGSRSPPAHGRWAGRRTGSARPALPAAGETGEGWTDGAGPVGPSEAPPSWLRAWGCGVM
jgi:hypothetical protein